MTSQLQAQIRFLLALFTLSLWCSAALGAKEVDLVIGDKKQQKMRFGIDYERLWFWNKSFDDEERTLLAKWSVVDTGVDYIRVAINSAYELKEGELDPTAYTKKIIPMMKEMKKANPDIKFFASPRPLNEVEKKAAWQPYPRWVTGDVKNNGSFDLDWQKCGEYLVRYFGLMREHGFKISFLDITNEWQSVSDEKGRLTGKDVKKIKAYLQSKLPADEMPLIVGPSSWNYQQGGQWLRSLDSGAKKALDIASSHNTDRAGSAVDFAKTSRKVLGKDAEIWNTELHGWKSTSKENEVTSFYYMLETIRAGFSGINGWLALGTPKQGHSYILNSKGAPVRNVKYFMFRKMSSTSNYGHALNIVRQPSKLSHAAALIKDDLMTVWVINQGSKDVPVKITAKGQRLAEGEITKTQWIKAEDVEGEETKLLAASSDSFSSVIPPKSVCCFEVPLKP